MLFYLCGVRVLHRISGRLLDMFLKVGQDALPGILRGGGIIGFALIIEKRMFGAGINFDVMLNLMLREDCIESLSRFGREVITGI